MTTIINGSSDINLDFSTGGRITGDFSNATFANRVAFQTTTANGVTGVGALPNGTSQTSTFDVYNAADPTNASFGQLQVNSSDVRLASNIRGTGSYLPMTFYTGGSESLRLSKDYKTVILSGGSTSANGTGITFPATQSASTNANTLDDYEEGTFTTTIAGESNVSAVSLVVGNYIKIGKQVTLFVKFNFTVTSSNLYTYWNFTLPFTSDSSNDNAGAAVENNIGRIGGVSTYGSSATAAYVIFPSASQVPSGVTACYISYTYRATA